ncbi:hypothetical protein ABE430_09000 [Brevibacillus agri]|uniref:hypothetical protein n=1 Tax=Brevibacillus agri TaxID=51101 RepID=UPI003D1A7FAA
MDATTYGSTGFFVLPRLTFRSKRDKLLFFDLVEQANFKDSAQCLRGQLITSASGIAEATGWTRDQVRYSLATLVKDGLILVEQNGPCRKQGLKITILNYESMQNLHTYKREPVSNFPHSVPQYSTQSIPNEEGDKNVDRPRGEGDMKGGDSPMNPQQNPQCDPHTRTASNNSNVEHKELVKHFPEQLRSKEDVEIFVDSQMLINPIGTGLPKKLFVEYFNTIRLLRRTGTLSANVARKTWDKLQAAASSEKRTSEANSAIILYALTVHHMDHDDKDEKYTLGIIRRTSEHEARQKFIRLVNRKHERLAGDKEGGKVHARSDGKPDFEQTGQYSNLF